MPLIATKPKNDVKEVESSVTWATLGTWDKFRFRCSSLPKVVTKTKPISESTLRTIHEQVHTGITKEISTPYTQKGIEDEPKAIEYLGRVRGRKFYKNPIKKANPWIQGTPDIVDKNEQAIIDVKIVSQKTFDTLTKAKALSKYFYQLVGYCWLWDYSDAELVFFDPEIKKIKRVKFKVGKSDIDTVKVACENSRDFLKFLDDTVRYAPRTDVCTPEEGFAMFMQGVAEDAQELRGIQDIDLDEIPF